MIVMDTCAIIWNALNPQALSKKAKSAIETFNAKEGLVFCQISLWEIAMLIQKKRFDPGANFQEFIRYNFNAFNYHLVGMDASIAELSTLLPPEINSDPADRIISATAMVKNLALVTSDKNIRKSKKIETIW